MQVKNKDESQGTLSSANMNLEEPIITMYVRAVVS